MGRLQSKNSPLHCCDWAGLETFKNSTWKVLVDIGPIWPHDYQIIIISKGSLISLLNLERFLQNQTEAIACSAGPYQLNISITQCVCCFRINNMPDLLAWSFFLGSCTHVGYNQLITQTPAQFMKKLIVHFKKGWMDSHILEYIENANLIITWLF